MPSMGRHGRSSLITPLLKHRLITGVVALAGLVFLLGSWNHREDGQAALLWAGLGVFMFSAAVLSGSLSIGPRPLRAFGAGAWLLLMALGAGSVWLGRSAIEPGDRRGASMVWIMAILAVCLIPAALWLMLWRPEMKWEAELRQEREAKSGGSS